MKGRKGTFSRAGAPFRRGETDLLIEFGCWFVALVLLPAFMGLRGTSIANFLMYSSAAAALLTLGSLLSTTFDGGWRDYRDLAISAFLAIVSLGGTIAAGTAILSALLTRLVGQAHLLPA